VGEIGVLGFTRCWQEWSYTLRVRNGAGIAAETVGLEKIHGEGTTAVSALQDVSLALSNGEFAATMGPSGSGKSMLLHIHGALDKPTSRRVVDEAVDPDQDEILEGIRTLESGG
jgi:ABC-type lipoprotein export system ATPase subunit